jgi:FMN phosphatase YigB (HAD superfamily)
LSARADSGAPGKDLIIHVALFDLDDTLYDCLHQRVEMSHRHAAEAAHELMVAAGLHTSVDAILAVRMRAFRQNPQLKHIDATVAREFGIAEAETISRAARQAYFSSPVGKLTLFPGALPVLRTLKGRGVRNFVVSYGELATQRAKVAALQLEKEESVEAIYYADRQKKLTKQAIFERVRDDLKVPARNFIVVGDRPSGEILAGNCLGMNTVRVRGGEFAIEEATSPEEEADFEIHHLEELLTLPFRWGG